MRRLALLLPLMMSLAAPLPAAAADTPFCAGLKKIIDAAASNFDWLPNTSRQLPGSIEERRGITRSPDGPPRAIFRATMLRDNSGQRPNPVDRRFTGLQAEIARCLPSAQVAPVEAGPRGALQTWTLPRAVVGLRRDDGEGFASSAELEVSVASRW